MNSRKRIATTPPPSAQSRTKAARQDIDQKTAILPRDLEKDDFIVPRAQHRAAKAEKHQYGQLLGAAEKVSLETQIPPGLTGQLSQPSGSGRNEDVFDPDRDVSKFHRLANHQALLRVMHAEGSIFGAELKMLIVDAETALHLDVTSDDYARYIAKTALKRAKELERYRRPSKHQTDRIKALKEVNGALVGHLQKRQRVPATAKTASPRKSSYWKQRSDTEQASRQVSPRRASYSPISDRSSPDEQTRPILSQLRADSAKPDVVSGTDRVDVATRLDDQVRERQAITTSGSDRLRLRMLATVQAPPQGNDPALNASTSINSAMPTFSSVSATPRALVSKAKEAFDNAIQHELDLTRAELMREKISVAALTARVEEVESEYESIFAETPATRLNNPVIRQNGSSSSIVMRPEHLDREHRLMLQMYKEGLWLKAQCAQKDAQIADLKDKLARSGQEEAGTS